MILLNDDTFLLFAAMNYDNPQCITSEEFKSDMNRVFHIKKLCTRFKEESRDKTRLLLNHIITLGNLFGPEATTKLLWLKCEEHFDIIGPMLDYLGILPTFITEIRRKNFIINTNKIVKNEAIIEELRKI